MSEELILEELKTVPIKVPKSIHTWLKAEAKRQGKSVQRLVLGWILEKYKQASRNEFVVEGKPEVVNNVAKATMKALAETSLKAAKEKGEISEEGFERFKREISKFVEIVPERAEEGRPNKKVREIDKKKVMEILDKNPRQVLPLLYGESYPKRLTIQALKRDLLAKIDNEALVEIIIRRLLDERVYIAEGNLLIYNKEDK